MKRKLGIAALLVTMLCMIFTGCTEQIKNINKAEIKYSTENGEVTVKEVPNKTSFVTAEIPDEVNGSPVTKIADFAAVNLESLEKITIGKNVKEIGTWAFENNQKLKEFDVDEENPYFCDIDGVLFTKDKKTLLFYPPARNQKAITVKDDKGVESEVQSIEYTIPEGVETIRTKAFYKVSALTKITLPKSLKKIEEKAFFRCSSLEEVTLPQGLTFIGKDAFGYCTAFKQITIPSSIEQIDEYAFFNCTNLINVTVEKQESQIKLGTKWYPTNNGKNIDDLKINWAK